MQSYRLTLTLEELTELLNCLASAPEQQTSEASIKLRMKIRLLHFKATNGTAKPTYTAVDKAQVSTKQTNPRILYEAYEAGSELTDQELREALTYGFENDLLSLEQEDEFVEKYITPNI